MKESANHYQQLVGNAEVFTKDSGDLSALLTALETQRTELTVSLNMLGDLITAASNGLPQIEKKIVEFTDQMTSAVFKNQTDLNKALTEGAAQIRVSVETSGKDIAKFNADISRDVSSMESPQMIAAEMRMPRTVSLP